MVCGGGHQRVVREGVVEKPPLHLAFRVREGGVVGVKTLRLAFE